MYTINENLCEPLIEKLCEKVENGEITISAESRAVELLEAQNPVFTETIIDTQIERLDMLHKKGTITDEEYKKQKASWEARRSNYVENLKREQEEEAAEKLKEQKKLKNRIKGAFKTFSSSDVAKYKDA